MLRCRDRRRRYVKYRSIQKNTGVSLRLFESLGVMFRWKYRESYYVLTLETQSRSDRASKIRIASVQSLNYLYCGRANPTSIGSGCNGCHMISDQVMKEKTGNANTKGSDVISRSKVSCLDII